jgi:hypothetical protein
MRGILRKDNFSFECEIKNLDIRPTLGDGVVVWSGIIVMPKKIVDLELGKHELILNDGRAGEIYLVKISHDSNTAFFVGTINQP